MNIVLCHDSFKGMSQKRIINGLVFLWNIQIIGIEAAEAL